MIGHVSLSPLIKKKQIPPKMYPVFTVPFLRLQNDECILFCQSWETGDIQSEAKDEKERRSHEELYPPTPKEIKIKQQEKRKEYLQRWQSKSQRSDHNFLGLEYRNAYLTYISVTFLRADWQLIRPCPHLWVSACLLRNTDTCLCSRHALSRNWADGRSSLVLVIWCFSLWLLKFPVMYVYSCVCMCLCCAQMQFFGPLTGHTVDSRDEIEQFRFQFLSFLMILVP